MVSSHEFAGTIVAHGPDVAQFNNIDEGDLTKLEIGTRASVASRHFNPCEPEDVLNAIGDGVAKTPRERGVDAVVILPETQKVFEYRMKILRYHRPCMMISTPTEGFHVSTHDVVLRNIKVVGALPGRRALVAGDV
ncbi:Mitochondrial tRNAs modification protein [Talaromyces marneffei ATCC 18224]|uniref:uncharacterized protein n=1 Tax=Talaromyces marneffei TaxID=37727 RepID=UPI0012AA082F|nr:uncharacterized protein EYB26_008446 [Talaromyces marneffei]QGA20738.1 hypothetical protein EYB26_008446 [Talaromyces marneffei]